MYFTEKDIQCFKHSEILLQKIEKITKFMEEQGFNVKWKDKDHILHDNMYNIFIQASFPAI